jgi:carbamoyl-phosphate synthase large subunit
MNVLITSASRDVTLIRTFQKVLASEGGGKVIAVELNPMTPAIYCADEHFLVPPSSDPSFLDSIKGLCEKNQIRLLIPLRDEELPIFASTRKEFRDINTIVMVAGPETIDICQDKKRFADFCESRSIPVPKIFQSTDIFSEKDLPLFAKPRIGKASKGVARISSMADLKPLLRMGDEFIIQEHVNMPEYTIDLFSDFDGRVISVVPRERVYVFGGESFVSCTKKHPTLIQEAIRLSTKLNLIGHNTIQCFFDGDQNIKFIEVNPRYGGAAHLGFAAGALTPLYLVKIVKGEFVESKIGEFQDNLVMLRYTHDLFIDGRSLSKKYLS